MAGPMHRKALYLRNRRRLLEGQPPCAIRARCNGDPATTADFIIPESKGGLPVMANLRPACKPCNSSRGNRTKTSESAAW